ncbi:hypothetical protein N7486_000171 [Penicillium sp. IBT 16267x]|nr:hypothetical protein N7486_000171 [Penicillium sp. IBT 16267x]
MTTATLRLSTTTVIILTLFVHSRTQVLCSEVHYLPFSLNPAVAFLALPRSSLRMARTHSIIIVDRVRSSNPIPTNLNGHAAIQLRSELIKKRVHINVAHKNSWHEPTPFVYRYQKTGYSYQTVLKKNYEEHKRVCSESLWRRNDFEYSYGGCGKTYRGHISDNDDDKTYKAYSQLRSHLIHVHGLTTAAQWLPYLPTQARRPWVTRICPGNDCRSVSESNNEDFQILMLEEMTRDKKKIRDAKLNTTPNPGSNTGYSSQALIPREGPAKRLRDEEAPPVAKRVRTEAQREAKRIKNREGRRRRAEKKRQAREAETQNVSQEEGKRDKEEEDLSVDASGHSPITLSRVERLALVEEMAAQLRTEIEEEGLINPAERLRLESGTPVVQLPGAVQRPSLPPIMESVETDLTIAEVDSDGIDWDITSVTGL